jgi:IMP cyclohydrolase
MDLARAADANLKALRRNPYPGRGIVIGLTPDARRLVQLYWIMGRSENSRNRIFVQEGDSIRTAPHDPSKVKDPSLVIYYCVRTLGRRHVVSNGDQTDTIVEALRQGRSFQDALFTRTFEPDAPDLTPRIAGLVDLDDARHAYALAILKSVDAAGQCSVRQFFYYQAATPGLGHCVTTYKGDGAPLPPFEGEPRVLPLDDDIDRLAATYWAALNADNRVSLLAKTIERATGRSTVRIVNKHG